MLMPVLGPTEQLLARLAPGTEAEALARPRYLYDRAPADAATALELAERDEARLLARLPATLDPLREDRQPSPARRDLLTATAAVEPRSSNARSG